MTISGQLATLMITLVTGALLGVLFDVYRIMRGIWKPRWFLTSLGDLVYWLLATAIVFVALISAIGGKYGCIFFWA